MIKHNYHTHTARCRHAVGEDEEYVLAAIRAGFAEIGFSDHSPWPFENGYVSAMRMTPGELDGYAASIKALKNKYKDKISVKLGLECEYFEAYLPWLRKILSDYGFDYVILGHHYSPNEPGGIYNGFPRNAKDLENYKNEVIKGIGSGLFSYVAHPDLFMRGYPFFDSDCERISKEIIAAAKEAEIPLEYNLQGIINGENDGVPGYPHPEFWRLAGEANAEAIIGIDAHSPDAFLDKAAIEKAQKLLSGLGLRLTESIKTPLE